MNTQQAKWESHHLLWVDLHSDLYSSKENEHSASEIGIVLASVLSPTSQLFPINDIPFDFIDVQSYLIQKSQKQNLKKNRGRKRKTESFFFSLEIWSE